MKLATNLTLDADYIGGGTVALLAKKGAGKTYAMRVMAEEFWEEQVPFVALDPMDAFWGLRSSANGKRPGIPVTIFGGPHGDAPLERTSGKLLADLVVDERLSMVCSLKHLGSRAAERQFAMDFLDRLYRRNSELVHLLIDEADLFAPQKPQAGDQPLLGITENIVRRGRNNGIGVTLATQRPAVLNKDVLTQVDGLITMRMLGPQDRNAINDWVGTHDADGQGSKIKEQLPQLATGEAFVWVPEQDVLRKVKFRRTRTFDSSPTQTRGQSKAPPKGYADVDLAAVEEKMAATIERQKAEDPKELRRRNAALVSEIEKLTEELAEAEQTARVETVEVPVPDKDLAATVMEHVERMTGFLESHLEMSKESAKLIRAFAHDRAPTTMAVGDKGPERIAVDPVRAEGGRIAARARARAGIPSSPKLSKAERSLLTVLVQYPQGREPKQLGILAGYKAGAGAFNNALGKLRSEGLITPAREVPIRVLDHDTAVAALGDYEPLPTGSALRDYWLAKLGKAEKAILTVLIEDWPEEVHTEDLANRAGYTPGTGGFNNALGSLRTKDLAEGYGTVKASDALFD